MKLMRAGLVLAILVGGWSFSPATAEADERACPAQKFTVGDGWGADRGRRSHAGIDLHARRGTPLLAVENGRVNRTKVQDNGAIQLVLDGASGSQYYYGHMDSVLVEAGQRVKAGQVVALMGDTGSPGHVHLHFEYWKSGRDSDAINPERFIERVCGIEIDD